MKVKIGDKAPLFEGTTDSGEKIFLSNLIGSKNVILYFYPKDDTPGCTAEACGFRDNWGKILSMDATVIGVSAQSVDSHLGFKKKYSLPFPLVSDPDNEIRKLYGATGFMVPPRITFVLDRDGVVRDIINSQLNITKHLRTSLQTLESIKVPQSN
ncbi:MAG: peroxiredoxin [Nitrososphaerales archaeon]